jgi:phosphoglycolate phosphatase
VTKACVFDLDGTLVDSLPGIALSLNRSLQAAGLPTHAQEKVRTFIGDGAEMLVKRAVGPAKLDRAQEVLALFREGYAEDWKLGTIPYEGIVEMLSALQQSGMPMAVLSNKPHAFTVQIVATLFPGIFCQVMGQQQGVPHKPDPAGLWQLMEQAGWHHEDVVMIGDSVMDLQTARGAQVQEIAVTWGYHDRAALQEIEPRLLIDHVHELRQQLLS